MIIQLKIPNIHMKQNRILKLKLYLRNSLFFFIGFLLVLRRYGDLSHRGPLVIVVIWIALGLLSCVWLRSSILKSENDSSYNYTKDVILVILHSIYLTTLLWKGSSTYVQRRTVDDDV